MPTLAVGKDRQRVDRDAHEDEGAEQCSKPHGLCRHPTLCVGPVLSAVAIVNMTGSPCVDASRDVRPHQVDRSTQPMESRWKAVPGYRSAIKNIARGRARRASPQALLIRALPQPAGLGAHRAQSIGTANIGATAILQRSFSYGIPMPEPLPAHLDFICGRWASIRRRRQNVFGPLMCIKMARAAVDWLRIIHIARSNPCWTSSCWPAGSACSPCPSPTPSLATVSEESPHARRICAWRRRDRGAAHLPRLCPAATRAVLRGAPHDSHRLDSDPALLRHRRGAGEAARRLHDARLQRRAHIPLAGAAPGRGCDLSD